MLMYGIYYRRHKDKTTATSALLLNIFIFSVLTVLGSVQFSLAAGFGLFAILALFTLRSEQLNRIDITYLFGSTSIAVLLSINAIDQGLMAIIVLATLASVYVIDHPRLNPPTNQARIKLDMDRSFDPSNKAQVMDAVKQQTGLTGKDLTVIGICGITETMEIRLEY